MSLRCPIPGRDPALFPHSHLPSLGGRFSGRGGFPLEIGSLRFDGRLGGRLCGLSLRRSGRRGPDCLPCLDSWPLFGREVRWGVLCRGRRLIWGNVDGGPAALLFTFSKQPFHTVLRLAHSTGRGILNLVAAIAVCLAALAVSRSCPLSRSTPSSSPRRASSLGAACIFSLSCFCTVGFSFIVSMEYHLPRRGGRARRAPPLLHYTAASASEGFVLMSR